MVTFTGYQRRGGLLLRQYYFKAGLKGIIEDKQKSKLKALLTASPV